MTIVFNKGGKGGSSGGASIAEDMYFATTTARDDFTTANTNRIYQGVTCAVENGAAYDYYQYDETGTLWRDANLIFQGRKGVDGRGIDDATIDGTDLTLYFTDGTESNVGKVVGDDGIDVTSATIEADGHLNIGLSNGTNIDAGRARGKDGDLVYELLDVSTYGDFFSAEWASKGTNIYGVTGLGSQFANSPFVLNASTTYSFEILLVNETNQYSMRATSMSNADFANSGRESVLAGNTKTAAESIGWKTLAFTSDSGHSDPADGFDLKPDADIGMDSTSAIMIKNNAGDYHNAIDQDINLDAIRLGSPSMRTYLRTNEDRMQIQTTKGMKTIAHLDDIQESKQYQLIEREDLHVVDEYYTIPETDLYKWKVYIGRLGNSIYDNIVHIKLPSLSTYEQYFWFKGVNDDKEGVLPPASEYVFSCGWEATAKGFRISSVDASIDVYGMTDLVTKVPNQIFRFQFVQFQNGRWGLVYSEYDETAWVPINQKDSAYSGTPSNFNVQIVDGVGYQRVDRQYPVTTTDTITEKFRLIRTVASEDGSTLPTVKKIQPPEIGSGFSFFQGNTDPFVGETILQISSGTYALDELGIDSATVGYGDEVYVQPDGSLGTTFSRYQCGWVLDDGIIIDIDLYNASALSEGGFPTDPIFNSVTTDLVKSKISNNNYLQFNGNVAELKTNQDVELNPSTSLKFKIGNTQKAILTALRLDMGDTPISNVPNAVLDKDAPNWKQTRDYVDSHVTPVPDDLSVNSLTAASFVSTPVIKVPATKVGVEISSEEAASFSLGSLDLKDTANNNNGTNVTGVYKIIGANSESHIAIPNANMVLHAKETVAFQDQGSDYLYIDRNQGIIFAGTTSGIIPDYSGNGAYLKGDKTGIKNWSGNDVLTVDKSQGDVVNANNHRIENLLAPVNDLDVTNKKFVVDITDAIDGRVQALEATVSSQEGQISQLLSSVISLQQDINELIESNKQSVTNFVMYSETDNTLRMDMERIGGQGLTQTVTFGQNPPPSPPEPPLPEQVTVYFGWDVNEMANMQASDFQNYQGTDERTVNLYITAETLMTTDLQITRSNTERYKYSYIAYPKGLVDPDPLKVTYSGFVDSWNSREMVIDGHTYIVLVPEYPNINATMDMKLSY
ncbi:hypothetical protein NVP1101O_113 [Vibrio phage 1.101.O._10N.261.45.C6]|nr:hypothetical protein NVP1101O_113 [Vibrio phage 1.101.O._10N.261.45.C6]